MVMAERNREKAKRKPKNREVMKIINYERTIAEALYHGRK